jgi:uncharacterized protein with FMN-binding domain
VKKTLFSLAFVAASGAYVAAANHLFTPPGEVPEAVATDTTLPPTVPSPITPPAVTVPLVASSQAAPPESPQIIAQATPADAQPATPAPKPPTEIAEPMPVPPLPRPRPTPPATVQIQPAASTTTAAAGSTSGYADGTYTGGDENAYYGRVQVQVTVTNHQVASVKVLDYPQDRRTSRYINSQALPMLKQEVIAAQSANIDVVSGATLTSEAYIKSLGGALARAGGAHA